MSCFIHYTNTSVKPPRNICGWKCVRVCLRVSMLTKQIRVKAVNMSKHYMITQTSTPAPVLEPNTNLLYLYMYMSIYPSCPLMLQRIFQCTCVFVAWHDIGVRKLLRQCVCVFVCSVALVKLLEWLFIGPNHGYT